MKLEIKENFCLKEHNTFGVNVNCNYFTKLEYVTQIEDLLKNTDFLKSKKLIIGEGSNILFTTDFIGWVVNPAFRGIEIMKETENEIFIKAFSGEKWDNFVEFCVDNNFYGVENLSHIPGKVGASPIQNIGAYGVEAKDIIESVEYYNFETERIIEIYNSECNFGYRNSIFKNSLKDKILIISVTYKLSKIPNFEIKYAGISEELKKFEEINLKNIRQSIINIRNSKLPKVGEIGSAGSFFKNPIISEEEYFDLKNLYPDIQSYKLESKNYKIPAAWLIEKAGYKGFRIGDVGIFPQHALILINYEKASGLEIKQLAKEIQEKIFKLFKIHIEPEVIML